MERTGQLQRLVATRRPGDTVTLDVIRSGDRRQIRVRLAEAPADSEPRAMREEAAPVDPALRNDLARRRLGITVEPLTPVLAKQYGLRSTQGVIVAESDRFGPAGRQGIGRGVRIVTLDGEPVADVAARAVALARAGGGGDELEEVDRLVRGGGGAARQRAAFEAGGLRALLAGLVVVG